MKGIIKQATCAALGISALALGACASRTHRIETRQDTRTSAVEARQDRYDARSQGRQDRREIRSDRADARYERW
jgi:hypothetical protein